MRKCLLAGLCLLFSGLPALAQTDGEDEILTSPRVFKVGDLVVAKGTQRETIDQAEVIDVILSTAPEGLTLAHPAEILNTVAGVNIHRGSGQEHLTAIRSPVLTGGAGCRELSLYVRRRAASRGGFCQCEWIAGGAHGNCLAS